MRFRDWRITRRDLRLASGLVMFTYVTFHFIGHTSGLYSIDVAERVLKVAVAIWHSVPGTVLLYSAAVTHVALALLAVYDRRTLRMPAAQALRIVLGFGMPLLLIAHLAATRIATELYDLAPTYHRVVWGLWTSGSQGRQLALLAPGWVHGCMGLNFAFGHRRWWQQALPVLFALAVLLPVLSGLGFLAMGRELAAAGGATADAASAAYGYQSSPSPSPASASPGYDAPGYDGYGYDAAAGSGATADLTRVREGLLHGWYALIALVLVARLVRTAVERHRRSVVRIAYPDRQVEVPRGWTVLEASRSFSIPHLSMCGGNARCSTCRVRVIEGIEACAAPAVAEQRTLERIHAPSNVRLACQLRPQGDIAVVPLLEAGTSADTAAPAIIERDIALLALRIVEWRTVRGTGPSAHDLAYALDALHRVVGPALAANGAFCSEFGHGGATASFGLTTTFETACRQALAAARAIDHDLIELDRRLAREVGFVADVVLVVHGGPAAIGPLGYGRERIASAFGRTVSESERLVWHGMQTRARFCVSRVVASAAALPIDDLGWQTLDDGLEITSAAG